MDFFRAKEAGVKVGDRLMGKLRTFMFATFGNAIDNITNNFI